MTSSNHLVDRKSSVDDRSVSPPCRINSGKGRNEGGRDDGLEGKSFTLKNNHSLSDNNLEVAPWGKFYNDVSKGHFVKSLFEQGTKSLLVLYHLRRTD